MTRLAAGAVVGVVAGLLSGAAGLGGAIISTPGIRLLGAAPLTAVGTTVPAIIVAAASGSWNYVRSGFCDLRVVAATGTSGVAFTVIGALLTKVVGGRPLMLATACLVIYGGTRILRGRSGEASGKVSGGRSGEAPGESFGGRFGESSRGRSGDGSGGGYGEGLGQVSDGRSDGPPADADGGEPRSVSVALLIGVAAGFLSGALGIGGGTVMLPAFFRFLKMPIKETTGTSLVIAGILAVPGTLTHTWLGNIDWTLAVGLSVGAVVGSFLGSKLTVGSGEGRVRTYVGLLLLGIGLAYGVGELISWARA